MKIILNEHAYVDFSDGRNYTLMVEQDVVDKKTKEIKKVYIENGYFGSLGMAVYKALTLELGNKQEEVSLETYYTLLKGAEKHTIEYFNQRAKELGIKRKFGD